MPWRVSVVAKIVVCVNTSGSRPVPSLPVVATQPQNRQLHVPTQTTLLSTVTPSSYSLLYQSFHLSHRHQHQMDAALAKLFVSNAQWVKAVNSAEPGFFEYSAQDQSPKVRAITTTSLLPP